MQTVPAVSWERGLRRAIQGTIGRNRLEPQTLIASSAYIPLYPLNAYLRGKSSYQLIFACRMIP